MGLIGNTLAAVGAFYHMRGNITRAQPLYDKAFKFGISGEQVSLACGTMFLRQGRFEDAMTLAQPFVDSSKAKHRMSARNIMGIAYWKLGDANRSAKVFRKMLEAGGNTMVYGSLGCVLIDVDLDEALALNLEALDFGGDDSVVLDNLGQIALLKGELDSAEGYFRRALKCRNGQVDSLWGLSQVYRKRGDNAKALEYVKNVLDQSISALCCITREQAEEAEKELEGELG